MDKKQDIKEKAKVVTNLVYIRSRMKLILSIKTCIFITTPFLHLK